MACCSKVGNRFLRMLIWASWSCGFWPKSINYVRKPQDCVVKIWNCDSRPGIGEAVTLMPSDELRRWSKRMGNCAVRFASCRPNALDGGRGSNSVEHGGL